MGDDGGYRTAAASSNDAVTLDELQDALREGPCVDALERGREHLVQDLDHDGPWPRFRTRAREVGFGSRLALPLLAGRRPVGALNVFAADPQGFTEQDVQPARRIAAPAAATLADARAYRRLTEQLQGALESRAVIEQAKGVLATQRRGDPDEASALLRQASPDHNRKLRDIARAVIARSRARDGDGGGRPEGATTWRQATGRGPRSDGRVAA